MDENVVLAALERSLVRSERGRRSYTTFPSVEEGSLSAKASQVGARTPARFGNIKPPTYSIDSSDGTFGEPFSPGQLQEWIKLIPLAPGESASVFDTQNFYFESRERLKDGELERIEELSKTGRSSR